MNDTVKFISYSGDWPCLCRGTLIIKIKGRKYELHNILLSGGCVDGEYNICVGPWELYKDNIPNDIRKDIEPYFDEILKVVNENVEWGCCGGCM